MNKLKSATIALLMLLTCHVYAQNITVTGTVTDGDTNEPLPGVNIVVKGTTNGTITNFDGVYSLSISSEDTELVYSFLGYQQQTLPIQGRTTIDVVLQSDNQLLDEFVVVGYGTQKKSDLTGSVAVVDVDEMTKTSNSNVGSMLQGRSSGVTVTSDGQPGADPTIRIRGFSTFGDASPLYVIDGVIVGGSIRDLSPNDIESMQVLKDASAAAIYGSRAANGVIIITTKQGKKNSPLQVSYKGYYGIDDVYQRMPVLGREDYQNVYNMSLINDGQAIRSANNPLSNDYIDNVDTNWQDAGFKTGKRQNHNVSLMGGGETGTYGLILDYMDSQGTLEGVGPDYTRYSVRFNNTVEKGIFSAGTSIFFSHTDQNTLNTTANGGFGGGNPPMVVKLLGLIPTMSVYDDTRADGWGTYNVATQGEDYSLNILAVNNMLEDITTVDRTLASGWGQIDLGEALNLGEHSLKWKTAYSYDQSVCYDFRWIPEFALSSFYTNALATLDEGSRKYTNTLLENTLSYNTKVGALNINAVVGQTYQTYDFRNVTTHGEGYKQPYIKEISNAATTVGNTYEEQAYIASYLGRVNLEYDNRYLFTATARRDATSRINAEDREGIFPSFSAGWKIHNESFFTVDDQLITEFKLRGGWGQLGNSAIGPYDYISVLNRNVVYNFNGQKVTGSTEPSVVSNLTWETKTMTNIGVDMAFLGNRVTASAEYYNSKSEDLLLAIDIPLSVGSINSAPTTNSATVRNSGFDFMVGYRNRDRAFKYDINANLSTLNNKVLRLNGDDQPRYGAYSRTIEGEEIARHFGYEFDGIFQSQSEVDAHAFQTASTAAGDIRFKDQNGDGIINEADRIDLGSSIPDFTFGLNFSAEYKNFDMSIFASGAAGFLIADNMYYNLMHTGGGLNWHEDILDAWTPENQSTTTPRVVYSDPNGNGRASNRPGWLQKGDYLRIANITVGYNLPSNVLDKIKISKARVYASVQNLHTFTAYKGYNPDFSNPDPFSAGYNDGSYPLPRTFMFGLNFDF